MTTACTTYYRYSDISTSGALTHRYYVRDYLGSTRAVVDEDGNVLQSTAYYPSGVPLTPNELTPQTIKLHTGKDFFDLQGAGWYDNQARYYDCLIPTFKSQDPLAEKYPWLSPYNHCANNPMRFVDKDGRILRDENSEIVYLTNGVTTTLSHPSGSTETLEVGFIFTNKFTPIMVFRNTSENIEWDTNCHGKSFTNGKFWINNDQIDPLLKDDNYKSIPLKKAEAGDIILFHGTSRNEHSMTVSETDGTIFGTTVEGIEGLGTSTVEHPFNKAWVLPNNSTVIRKGEIDIEISNEIIDYIKQLLYE